MTEATPEDLELVPEPTGEPDPEEYQPDDSTGAISEATGTVYDELGEADSTPQDAEPEEGSP